MRRFDIAARNYRAHPQVFNELSVNDCARSYRFSMGSSIEDGSPALLRRWTIGGGALDALTSVDPGRPEASDAGSK